MRFSNDGINWTDWELYVTSKSWTLSIGDGTKTVLVQFMDNAGLISQYEDTIILDTTQPTANAGSDQAVDEDTLMTFDGSASIDNIGITSYTWTFLDGTLQTLTGTNPAYTFNTPGSYTVTLSVTDAVLHSATDTVVITVLDITKPVADAGDDQVVHEDTMVTFSGSDSTDNVGIANYVWTFNDVKPQTLLGVNATYIFGMPSVYNVTLTVSDAQGNSATDIVTITVIDATWPAANAGPDQIVEEDGLVDFNGSASSDNVGIITFVWTFTDGTLQTMFGVSPSYPFETPGVYTVTLNVTDAEGHFTTDTVVITVQDTTPPLIDLGNYATIVENAPVNLDASGSLDNVAIVDYLWNFGDGTSENSTIPSVVHTYTKPGVYMITLTVADEAGNIDSTSTSIVVYRDTDGDLIADHIDTDDDNDEMPDDWEIFHGLNPLDPSDASLDPDGLSTPTATA
jgi:PKD repeat protein